MKIILSVIACSLLLVACATKQDLKTDLVGEWRNLSLKITMNTVGNRDTTIVTQCDSTNWEQMLHIKPIRTFYNPDGSYRCEYYTLQDSLFSTTRGTWTVSNDTVIMNQTVPEPTTYKLKTTVKGAVASFDGMMDFDEDGMADDHYEGQQRKQ